MKYKRKFKDYLKKLKNLSSKKLLKAFFAQKRNVASLAIFLVFVGGFFAFQYIKAHKSFFALSSLSMLGKVSQFLPMQNDTKKELEVVNSIMSELRKTDDKERTFMVMLQNDSELRPGGGFLGQYAIIKIKNGEITSTYVEDANLLDQRIKAKIPTPYPFKRMMNLKNWKFRDSNFSPDFPTNVEKAKYFYRLSGRSSQGLDGVIAVNSQVFNDVFSVTGPIDMGGAGEFNQENASRKLEEIVEKKYLFDDSLDTQNRKAIMKQLAPLIMEKMFTVSNLSKVADLFHSEMQKKNVMVNFSNPDLQKQIESVHWDGRVATDWGSDYLMAVDANMGALKTDYYIKREMTYDIDFTGSKPVVNLSITYNHTAPYGDWRTSDYHSYLRVYVPKGSTLLESKMANNIIKGEEFNKTYFGYKLDVLIGKQTDVQIKYELPESITAENYRLLVQKQSGVGTIPFKIHVKTKGKDFTEEFNVEKDLQLEYNKN